MTALAIALAWCVDAVFGDPGGWPHPVRLVGAACERAERLARRYARDDASRELVAGTVLCAAIVGGTFVAARVVIAVAYRIDRRCGFVADIALGWTALAARNLLDEAASVIAPLERGDVARARVRVARIVGRDTGRLDAAGIACATIETLAESACDGVVAPLLALAAGGAPLALAFKAVSTLDSMIGHIEPPYTFLGRASARIDDLACYFPARLTALTIVAGAPLVGGSAQRAWAVLRADGHRHRSPNGGQPEAAIAGALGVRLGGARSYDGVASDAEVIGAGLATPTVAAARRALRLVAAVTNAIAVTLVSALAVREFLRAPRR